MLLIFRGEDCMEMFSKYLKYRVLKIINHEKKEMRPLTNDENKSYEKQKNCYIYKKEFSTDKNDEKKLKYTKKSEIIFITQKNLEELLIVFVI